MTNPPNVFPYCPTCEGTKIGSFWDYIKEKIESQMFDDALKTLNEAVKNAFLFGDGTIMLNRVDNKIYIKHSGAWKTLKT